jgi:uncharacterized protein
MALCEVNYSKELRGVAMFIGRTSELRVLEEDFQSGQSNFCIVYGRRRIGKSTLLHRFTEGRAAFFFQAGRESKRRLMRRFGEELGVAARDPLAGKTRTDNWGEALLLLDRMLPALAGGGKAIVVLDEFQWMCRHSPELLTDLQRMWDNTWSKSGNLFLVLCGSSVSFMLGDVLSEKSPLFGRRTRSIHLQPFSFPEAALFLPARSVFEAAEIYMACGGVAKYLEVVAERASFRSAVGPLFLSREGYFFDEVTFALSEQLKGTQRYFSLLRCMSRGIGDMASLERATGIATGQIAYYLERLVLLGFVSRHMPVGALPTAKRVRYVLDDYYLRFYFTFVEPLKRAARRAGAGAPTLAFEKGWDQYAGRAFELLARDHAAAIVRTLGHAGEIQDVGTYWRRPTAAEPGVQIDLVVECADNTTLVCECKWSRTPCGADAVASVAGKVAHYPNPRNHTLKGVLVAAAGVKGNAARNAGVHVVTLEDLAAA